MSNHLQTIPAVAAYFGSAAQPIVAQEFHPTKGWQHQTYRKRISRSWARKLRRAGISHVALDLDGRLADFSTAELCRGRS